MRPQLVSMSAAGYSAWQPMNRLQWLTNVGMCVVLSSGATLTYTVQHTFDDLWVNYQHCTISRAGTVATLKKVAHGLSVGDNVVVQASGSALNLDGSFQVATVVDDDNITYTVGNTGITADTGDAKMVGARVFPHAVLVNLTARADSNYAFPLTACRLYVSAWTSGSATLILLQGD